ncbi:radical SAM protein [Natroniella sulfidigena]|uniref:radical SAM protein n=1 Tax=Natroniella sulfidigena TaxID=723921 RepID=UPI00200AFD2A|nr:radical SAM protein [Natroniella sulfidigena]MCK8816781.1 radical SAM protein [Natroniella sulfidigena]
MPQPSYLELYRSGELADRAKKAYQILQDCKLCPHHCLVDRTQDELGYCKTGKEIRVASFGPHFGEETPLVGRRGSGTIFFSSCNLRCIYCQNYDTSHQQQGELITAKELAEIMISLQRQGCHNINFVTPSHMIHALLAATLEATKLGLEIPLIYNSGGYDNLTGLKLLDGVIDIYMPDVKYADEEIGLKYSKVSKYLSVVKKAVKEMHRQVGDLKTKSGIAYQGLLIRHLVLPNNLAGSQEIMEFINHELSANTYVNIMEQYYPAYRAGQDEQLNRRITEQEYKQALNMAKKAGLKRIES